MSFVCRIRSARGYFLLPPGAPELRSADSIGSYFDPILTVRLRRPLCLRRFRAFRPPFVFIRARKPCLFSRFRFRGLYVGFMIPRSFFSVPVQDGSEHGKVPARAESSQAMPVS